MFYPIPESGTRKIRHQIVWQTRQKPTPVFWGRFLAPVSGACVMGISIWVELAGACWVGVSEWGVSEFVVEVYGEFRTVFAVSSNKIAIISSVVWLVTSGMLIIWHLHRITSRTWRWRLFRMVIVYMSHGYWFDWQPSTGFDRSYVLSARRRSCRYATTRAGALVGQLCVRIDVFWGQLVSDDRTSIDKATC